jgi:hypothetical protein
VTPTEKLPTEGTLSEALHIYSSRLRIFAEVALYTGSILGLIAYPLIARTAQQKAYFFLALLCAFVLFYGLPGFVRTISSAICPRPVPQLDATQIAVDAIFTYELLSQFVSNRTSDRVALMQRTALELVGRFPGEVRLEKTYSIAHDRTRGSLLIIQERLIRLDQPIPDTLLTAMIRIDCKHLDDDQILSIVRMISGFGLAFPPDKVTIKRSVSIPEGFAGLPG